MSTKIPKLVVLLNELDTLIKPAEERMILRFVREVEDAGYYGISTAEHVVLGPNANYSGERGNSREFLMPGNQSPYQHWPHPFIKLAAIAAVTERVRLCATATLTPLRHPLLNAKELATLDLLSGGRVTIVPIGGWNKFEYDALGVPYHERGARLDEHLEILELVSKQSPATYHGEFYNFTDAYLEPKPVQPGGIKIWVGGDRMTKKVVERIVRFGQGYSLMTTPSGEELTLLNSELKKAGRDISEIEHVSWVSPSFEDTDSLADIERAVAESLVPRVKDGATVLAVKPSQFIDDPSEMPKFLRNFADAVERACS